MLVYPAETYRREGAAIEILLLVILFFLITAAADE